MAIRGMSEYLTNLNLHGFALISDLSRLTLDFIGAELGSRSSLWHQISARSRQEASPQSLSGIYGRDEFPWHSDGAVAYERPRYVIMHCGDEGYPEPTEVLSLRHASTALLVRSMARTVLVVEHPRQGRRYTSALERTASTVAARWDTRVCRPVDSSPARETIAKLAEVKATGVIEWRPGTGAIIDNFAALHRRPRIESQSRILNRKYVFQEKEA